MASPVPKSNSFRIKGSTIKERNPANTLKLGQSEETPPAAIPSIIIKKTIWWDKLFSGNNRNDEIPHRNETK